MIPRWLRGALPFAVTLAAGIAIGVAHERIGRGHLLTGLHASLMGGPGRMFDDEQLMAAVEKAVHPDSAQRVALREVIRKRQGEIDSVWVMIRPGVIQAMEGTHRDVLAILRPDQQKKFLQFIRQVH